MLSHWKEVEKGILFQKSNACPIKGYPAVAIPLEFSIPPLIVPITFVLIYAEFEAYCPDLRERLTFISWECHTAKNEPIRFGMGPDIICRSYIFHCDVPGDCDSCILNDSYSRMNDDLSCNRNCCVLFYSCNCSNPYVRYHCVYTYRNGRP